MVVNNLVLLEGLGGLVSSVIANWIGPIFVLGVAAYSLILLKDREIRKAAMFMGLAAVVGLLIFFGNDLFGKEGKLTKGAKSIADKVDGK